MSDKQYLLLVSMLADLTHHVVMYNAGPVKDNGHAALKAAIKTCRIVEQTLCETFVSEFPNATLPRGI